MRLCPLVAEGQLNHHRRGFRVHRGQHRGSDQRSIAGEPSRGDRQQGFTKIGNGAVVEVGKDLRIFQEGNHACERWGHYGRRRERSNWRKRVVQLTASWPSPICAQSYRRQIGSVRHPPELLSHAPILARRSAGNLNAAFDPPDQRAQKKAGLSNLIAQPGFLIKDPGDNRLSHQRHYHRPGGLNGRVRNGNGCGPASMVAGKAPSRRSGRLGTIPGLCRTRKHALDIRMSGEQLHVRSLCQRPLNRTNLPRRWLALPRVFGHEGKAAPRSGWSSCLAVRTGRLKRSPAVHARPIDLVVFQEPTHYCWKPNLGGGFALRCLQRLSCPDLATRRCR